MARMSPKGSQNMCLAFTLLGSGQFHKENSWQGHPIPPHIVKIQGTGVEDRVIYPE